MANCQRALPGAAAGQLRVSSTATESVTSERFSCRMSIFEPSIFVTTDMPDGVHAELG